MNITCAPLPSRTDSKVAVDDDDAFAEDDDGDDRLCLFLGAAVVGNVGGDDGIIRGVVAPGDFCTCFVPFVG